MITKPPWPNGYGIGLLSRGLRVRVPPGVHVFAGFGMQHFLEELVILLARVGQFYQGHNLITLSFGRLSKSKFGCLRQYHGWSKTAQLAAATCE